MQINVWRDPYGEGFNTTKPKMITLEPGLTVLVGCNGTGKTTLMRNIDEYAKKQNIPCHYYNNLSDGGHNAMSQAIFETNYNFASNLLTASEGEAITMNVGMVASLIKEFLVSGRMNTRKNQFARAFDKNENENDIASNIRILMFDAVDSGLSIDNIEDLKAFFKLILEDGQKLGREVYIIVAANEYELARNEKCFDVVAGKYIVFKNYEAYRKFILKSRVVKEQRLVKQQQFMEKQKVKQYKLAEKEKTKAIDKINKIEQKAHKAGRELSYFEKRNIESLKRQYHIQ